VEKRYMLFLPIKNGIVDVQKFLTLTNAFEYLQDKFRMDFDLEKEENVYKVVLNDKCVGVIFYNKKGK